MKLKTLTLPLLTAIVMASVACGPYAEEVQQVALCEDALERRTNAQKWLSTAARYVSIGSPITEAAKDIGKYCK